MADVEQGTGEGSSDQDEPRHDDVGDDRREKFARFVDALDRVLEHATRNGEVYDGAVADHQTITDVLAELREELGA